MDALVVVLLVVGLAWPWDGHGTGMLAIILARLLLLLSPAIRHHNPNLSPE